MRHRPFECDPPGISDEMSSACPPRIVAVGAPVNSATGFAGPRRQPRARYGNSDHRRGTNASAAGSTSPPTPVISWSASMPTTTQSTGLALGWIWVASDDTWHISPRANDEVFLPGWMRDDVEPEDVDALKDEIRESLAGGRERRGNPPLP